MDEKIVLMTWLLLVPSSESRRTDSPGFRFAGLDSGQNLDRTPAIMTLRLSINIEESGYGKEKGRGYVYIMEARYDEFDNKTSAACSADLVVHYIFRYRVEIQSYGL